jgi:serine/threonine protein kinase
MNSAVDLRFGDPVPTESAAKLDDSDVVAAVRDYMAALEAGRRPDRAAILARYPALADALAEVLDGLEFMHTAASRVRPVSEPAELLTPDAPPGMPLGDFRILREIGRGGMGIVYEAEQISLGRRVALKVLPFASTLDPKQLQRFKNEAQAAAGLHHTNIVPVYATGCERGVHFYAMQFIEGRTLAAVIEELRTQAERRRATKGVQTTPWEKGQELPAVHESAADDSWATAPGAAVQLKSDEASKPTNPQLGFSTDASTKHPAFFRTVAQLGIQAAEALEHAHQLGVVHRDIKPANLLIQGEPGASATGVRLWITDFGLAQVQSNARLTLTGDLVGTVRYMSPEQTLAKRVLLDHRTDVYSLGVTLYELLTLQPAFTGRNRHEVVHQIAFEEPKRPRLINRAIPAELETIVLKAIEKNPAERYATAQEMADDLERFLKDEPIRAKRPSPMMRARKWARRHAAISWSAVIVTFLALAATALFMWREKHWADRRLADVEEEKKKTEAALTAESEQRQFAGRNEAEAKRMAAGANSVIRFLILDMLHAADPWQTPRQGTTVLEVLANAERQIDTAFPDQPLVEAAARRAMGMVYARLAQYGPAARHITKARDLRGLVLGAEHSETVIAEADLALVLYYQGEHGKAVEMMEKVVAAMRRLGAEQRNTLNATNNLAVMLIARGKNAEALKLLEETIQVQERVRGKEDPDTLNSLNNLPIALEHLGKRKEASELREKILGMQQRILGKEHPDTLMSMTELATELRRQGKLAESRKLHEETIALQKRILGPTHPDTLKTMNNLAITLSESGKLELSHELHQEVLDVRRRILGPAHPDTLRAMNNLADSFWEQGKLPEARKLLEEVLPRRIQLLGKGNLETLTTMNNMANVLGDEGKLDEARKLHEEVLDGRRRVLGLEHPDTLRSWQNVASTFLRGGQVDEGRKHNEEILIIRNRVLGPAHPDTLLSKFELATIMGKQGKLEEGAMRLEEVLASQTRVIGPQHPATLRTMKNLIIFLHALALEMRKEARYQAEEMAYRRALELLEKRVADNSNKVPFRKALADGQTRLAFFFAACPDPKFRNAGQAAELAQQAVNHAPEVKLSWIVLGIGRYRSGNWNGTLDALDQSRKLSQGASDIQRSLFSSMEAFYLALAHWRLKQKEEATHWYEKAVEEMQKGGSQIRDLQNLKAEAAELLGIKLEPVPHQKPD